MFNQERGVLTPLHQAIIEDDREQVAQLKGSKWHSYPDAHGFTPLELAQLLGRRQCQDILQHPNPTIIKVQLKGAHAPTILTISEFENNFNIVHRPFLTFPSYQTLEEVIRNCPYLLRFEQLMLSSDEREAAYQAQLSSGATADTCIQWINPVLGYGLFSATDLPENSFVGEYTGVVRGIDRQNPDLNAYCFHYPTRFWSFKYFVIDALREGNHLRFINHSDQPNLQPLWLVNRGVLHLIFVTNRFINQGTELTFNYGSDYWIRRKKFERDLSSH
jgi:hypothetical protein